jgi:hypothetical protein
MIQSSDIVVIGQVDDVVRVEPDQVPTNLEPFTPVVGKDPSPPKPFILAVNTTFGFTIQRVLKGDSAPAKVLVRQASGVYDRTLYLTGEDRPLVPGERYLLFLVRSRSDPSAYEPNAFIAGQYPIRGGIVRAAYEPSELATLIKGRSEAAAIESLLQVIRD